MNKGRGKIFSTPFFACWILQLLREYLLWRQPCIPRSSEGRVPSIPPPSGELLPVSFSQPLKGSSKLRLWHNIPVVEAEVWEKIGSQHEREGSEGEQAG